MYVRDIMTTNVVTIPSSTSIADAKRIMEAHRIRRLVVVDKGKLVGMITKAITRRVAPSEATSLSVWEINYLMAKMVVKDVMKTDVVTVSPDVTVECAVATAQQHGVGALPVLEDDVLVGILTTNDFFYKILNPLLSFYNSFLTGYCFLLPCLTFTISQSQTFSPPVSQSLSLRVTLLNIPPA